MSDERSLIKQQQDAQAAQLRLFGDTEVEADALEAMEVHGDFTGERLFRFKPHLYQAIVIGLAEGLGIRQLSRAFKVSPNTVMAVRDREHSAIETEKIKISTTLRRFVQVAAERLLEEVNEIDIDKLGVPLGIAVDKLQLLDGQPTQRVETTKQPGIADFNQMLQQLPRTIDIEARETTGLSAEERLQMARPAIEVGDESPDKKSGVLSSSEPSNVVSDAASDDTTLGNQAVHQVGGAGVAVSPGGGQIPKRFKEAENFEQGSSEVDDSEERESRIKKHGNQNPGSY